MFIAFCTFYSQVSIKYCYFKKIEGAKNNVKTNPEKLYTLSFTTIQKATYFMTTYRKHGLQANCKAFI